MRKIAWVGALAALLAGCKADYVCGPLVYSEAEGRCVCPPGSVETADGRCILADGGVLYPPGWDGSIDEDAGAPTTCPDGRPPRELFEDADGDGHGRIGSGTIGCEGVTLGDDCDDACRDCYPGAIEICDGRDNDCASGPDDTFACVRGAATECETTCGSTGVVACGLDCAVPAGAACTPPDETCNGADDDCDALTDEGVLRFGEPVDWPVGRPVVVETTAGFVSVQSDGETPLSALRFDSSGIQVGTAAAIASPGVSPGAYAATTSGDSIVVVWVAEGALWLAELDGSNLGMRIAPRQLASGAASPVAVVVAGFYTTVVHGTSGGGLISRTLIARASDSGTTRTLVTARSTYDRAIGAAASRTTAGRLFVGYADVPTGESDTELFVQIIDGGELVGERVRLTMNDVVEKSPTLTVRGDGVIGIAWLESSSVSDTSSRVRAHTLGASSTSVTITSRPLDDLGIAVTIFTDQLHLRVVSRGWALAYPAAAGDSAEHRVRILDSAMVASSAEVVPEPVTAPLTDIAIALLAPGDGTRIGVVNMRANFELGAGAARMFWLGCE